MAGAWGNPVLVSSKVPAGSGGLYYATLNGVVDDFQRTENPMYSDFFDMLERQFEGKIKRYHTIEFRWDASNIIFNGVTVQGAV